jgi:hypothetical protein
MFQLQKLFQITLSSSTNFLDFFSIYSYFYGAIFVQKCFKPEKNSAAWSHLSATSLPAGPAYQSSFGMSMPRGDQITGAARL